MVGKGCVCLTAATLWSSKVILDNCWICWWVWMAEIRLHSMWHYFTGRKTYKSSEEEEYKQAVQREKHENLPPVPQNYAAPCLPSYYIGSCVEILI